MCTINYTYIDMIIQKRIGVCNLILKGGTMSISTMPVLPEDLDKLSGNKNRQATKSIQYYNNIHEGSVFVDDGSVRVRINMQIHDRYLEKVVRSKFRSLQEGLYIIFTYNVEILEAIRLIKEGKYSDSNITDALESAKERGSIVSFKNIKYISAAEMRDYKGARWVLHKGCSYTFVREQEEVPYMPSITTQGSRGDTSISFSYNNPSDINDIIYYPFTNKVIPVRNEREYEKPTGLNVILTNGERQDVLYTYSIKDLDKRFFSMKDLCIDNLENSDYAKLRMKNAKLEDKIKDQEDLIYSLKETLSGLNVANNATIKEIKDTHDRHIAELEARIARMESEHSSEINILRKEASADRKDIKSRARSKEKASDKVIQDLKKRLDKIHQEDLARAAKIKAYEDIQNSRKETSSSLGFFASILSTIQKIIKTILPF